MTTLTTAVELRGVSKTFGPPNNQVHALRDVDLTVYAGELLMLVGPSGCGKTTLISVAAGILEADAGDCVVFGQSLRAMRSAERTRFRRDHVGFVFQAFNLLPTVSVVENVAIPLLVAGVPRRSALPRALALLERVGLAARAHALPTQLSGGQQQRVAIARALVHQPRLLVCDEPTSALDHTTGMTVMELLREVALGPQRALIIVTHDQRIFPYADRIAHVDDGRLMRIETRTTAVSSSVSP